ncbi:hypothetical protein [Mycoplasmopsis alligatoris]|uniref:Uncharacterized protein n=1 Tax=Mycoplasmopsis alligatoris A21JP2 TaxID=747682 RepID=D4XX38_9BACT|nr:hypothetical protein [Mycoplasmopsis alligatoris]EFF41091.1 hypothetical protein MALL_0808 [Mycoplasmopsis alligatoris A21JP2]
MKNIATKIQETNQYTLVDFQNDLINIIPSLANGLKNKKDILKEKFTEKFLNIPDNVKPTNKLNLFYLFRVLYYLENDQSIYINTEKPSIQKQNRFDTNDDWSLDHKLPMTINKEDTRFNNINKYNQYVKKIGNHDIMLKSENSRKNNNMTSGEKHKTGLYNKIDGVYDPLEISGTENEIFENIDRRSEQIINILSKIYSYTDEEINVYYESQK